jgi:hypothetical protein
MKQIMVILVSLILIGYAVDSCSNRDTSLPEKLLKDNDWLVFGLDHRNDEFINVKFNDSNAEAYMKYSKYGIACQTTGKYSINEDFNIITISGMYNSNCPDMSKINGTYKYKYKEDGSRHIYEFLNGGISLYKSSLE